MTRTRTSQSSHLSNFDDPSVLSKETRMEHEKLGFTISDIPVDKSAVYKMKENTLQKICICIRNVPTGKTGLQNFRLSRECSSGTN